MLKLSFLYIFKCFILYLYTSLVYLLLICNYKAYNTCSKKKKCDSPRYCTHPKTGEKINTQDCIDERMEKEKDNIQDPEYYEKLKNVIEDEKKALVDNKQNEFEKKLKEIEKKTWSKLTKEEKERILDNYIKEHNITNGDELKTKINKRKIRVKDIEYDRVNEKIISIKDEL